MLPQKPGRLLSANVGGGFASVSPEKCDIALSGQRISPQRKHLEQRTRIENNTHVPVGADIIRPISVSSEYRAATIKTESKSQQKSRCERRFTVRTDRGYQYIINFYFFLRLNALCNSIYLVKCSLSGIFVWNANKNLYFPLCSSVYLRMFDFNSS